MSTATDSFYNAVLGDKRDTPARERGVVPGRTVKLYAQSPAVNADGATNADGRTTIIHVGRAEVEADHNNREKFSDSLHGHRPDPNMVILRNFQIPMERNIDDPSEVGMQLLSQDELALLPYPYTFKTVDEIPRTMKDLKNTRFVWDDRAMREVVFRTKTLPNLSRKKQVTKEGPSPRTPVKAMSAKTSVAGDDDLENEEEAAGGVSFKHRTLNKGDYKHLKVIAHITQIADFDHPLRPLDEAHSNNLRSAFLDPKIGYAPQSAGIMTTTILHKDLLAEETIFDLLTETSQIDTYTLKKGRTMTIVDGRHRMKAIRDCAKYTSTETSWSRGNLLFGLITRFDEKLLTNWEVLMQSKQKNDASCLVRTSSAINDLLLRIVSYRKIFKETYGIDYIDANTKNIVEDMMESQFMGNLSSSTVAKYVRMSKCLLRYSKVMEYLLNDCDISKAKEGKRTHISYFFDSRLLGSKSQDEILLQLKCVNFFYNKPNRGKFVASHFYSTCAQFLSALRDYYNRLIETPTDPSVSSKPASFSAFMQGQFYISSTLKSTPEQFIFNNMKTYNYSEADKGKKTDINTKRTITRLFGKLDVRYLPVKEKDSDTPEPETQKNPRPERKRRQRASNRGGVIDLTDDLQGENKELPGKTESRSKSKKEKTKTKDRDVQAAVQDGSDVDAPDHGSFDDSFDVARPPANWAKEHKVYMALTDSNPSTLFLKNVRSFPSARDGAMEMDWEAKSRVQKGENPEETIADISAYLRSIHIPKDHRAHLFLTVDHFKALRTLAIFWGIYSELFNSAGDPHLNPSLTADERWEKVPSQDEYLAKAYFEKKKIELDLAGYTILEGMADPFAYPSGTLDNGYQHLANYPTMSSGEMFDKIHGLFPGEDNLRDEDSRSEWNPIVNTGDTQKDKNNRNMGVARYSSTAKFLMETLETKDCVHLAHRRAYLDVWVGLLLAFIDLDHSGKFRCYIPRTGGRFLLTGRNCSPQSPHNDYVVGQPGDPPGYFVIVTGPERANLWLLKGTHLFIHYNDEDKRKLGNILKLEQIVIPPTSIFIGHGHLQHAGDGYSGSHCLRYHIYVTPENQKLPDAIIYGYGVALGLAGNKKSRAKSVWSESRPTQGIIKRVSPTRTTRTSASATEQTNTKQKQIVVYDEGSDESDFGDIVEEEDYDPAEDLDINIKDK